MARLGGVVACVVSAFWLVSSAAAADGTTALERSVQALTGQRFGISCVRGSGGGQGGWAGLTELSSPPRILLSSQTCTALLDRAGSDAFDRAFAVKTLAHEAGHALFGTACEYQAETYAMANWRRLYRLIERTAPSPPLVAYVTATHLQLPPAYRAPGPTC